MYRELLKMFLEELKLMEEQIVKPDREIGNLPQAHQRAVQGLAAVCYEEKGRAVSGKSHPSLPYSAHVYV